MDGTIEVASSWLNVVTTYGAGVVALGVVFYIIWLVGKQVIPTLKAFGDTFTKAIEALGSAIDVLSATMAETQKANTAAMNSLERAVEKMETKLDYHVKGAERIESKVHQLILTNAEIRERVRNCGNQREPSSRTRRDDNV